MICTTCEKPATDDDVFCDNCADMVEYIGLLFTGTDKQLEQKAKEINFKMNSEMGNHE